MSTVWFDVDIDTLAPGEARDVVHVVDGTVVRAEILETDTRRFQARILEPFEQVVEKRMPLFMVYLTDAAYVRDGRRTALLEKDLQGTLEAAFRAWRQRELEEAWFLANRCPLEPLLVQAHREASGTITALEADVSELQALGEALDRECRRRRNGLREQFKAEAIDQTAYQRGRKSLREKGPGTEWATPWLVDAERLRRQVRTLGQRLEESETSFRKQARIDLGHAAALMGLPELPLGKKRWLDRATRLEGLGPEASRLLGEVP